MLRDAGAAEVHMRISAPPIRYPCHYGIDMSTSEEMVAHDRTVEEVAQRARLRLARLPLARGRLRGDPLDARRPTATPASPASTRSSAPTRRTGSSRSRKRRRSGYNPWREARGHPPHHLHHRRRAAQRRLLRARDGPADGQEDRQPGPAHDLPPLLRRRGRLAGPRPDVLRVPGRRARQGGRGDGPPPDPPRRLRRTRSTSGPTGWAARGSRRGARAARSSSPTRRASSTSSPSSTCRTRR